MVRVGNELPPASFYVHTQPIIALSHRKRDRESVSIGNERGGKLLISRAVRPYWQAKLQSGVTVHVDDDYVRKSFGDALANDIIEHKVGWVDIAPGASKTSQLHKYPNLVVDNAPVIRFQQSFDQDLCLTKSFASVLFHLGFCDEARAIDRFGFDEFSDGAYNPMEKLRFISRKILPNWIENRKMPRDFDWKTDLEQGQILVAVLKPIDGNISHAISIHNGFIYDANEDVAIPLCEEGLDYCTIANDGTQSKFENFWRGIVYFYKGTKKQKIGRLMGQVKAMPSIDQN